MSKKIEKSKTLENPYWKIVENERREKAALKIQKVARKFIERLRALNEKHQMNVV